MKLRTANEKMTNYERRIQADSASLMNETPYNPLMNADSYKVGQWLQYPEGATAMFSYIESRGGVYDRTVFFGLQYILQKFVEVQITMDMIDEAEDFFMQHFGQVESFNRKGWEHIVKKYNGFLPVEIKAVPEGTVVPTKNVLVSMYCDDPDCFWAVGYIETLLLRVWNPITTATKSFHVKEDLMAASEISSDEPTENLFALTAEQGVPASMLFKLHDFGARGASSYETASISGLGHLINFYGTDTLSALKLGREHYAEPCAGYSIDASEHSTMTALGPDGEIVQFERMVDKFGDRAIFACVSDGFDIWKAIREGWGGVLLQRIIDMNAILVVRPDSGDPIEVPVECVKLLDEKFGSTLNNKKYKVLNHVRVIQGDGIGAEEIRAIAKRLHEEGYSFDNMAYGSGGWLLQKQNRDTQKFACKNAWMMINGESVNVFKDPITDHGKKSKKGRMTLIECDGVMQTVTELTDEQFFDGEGLQGEELLVPVYSGGRMVKAYELQEIRERTETYLRPNREEFPVAA